MRYRKSKRQSSERTLGSVCSEVAKVAGVVASIAAVIATAGAATPLAALAIGGAILSSASFADGEFHVLHKLGVDDRTAAWIDTGMAIGSAVLSVGAGVGAGGRAASNTIGSFSRLGAGAAGVAVVGKGACEIQAGEALATADRAAADRTAAHVQLDHTHRIIQLVIDAVANADQHSRQIAETIAGTKTIEDQTALSAAAAVRG